MGGRGGLIALTVGSGTSGVEVISWLMLVGVLVPGVVGSLCRRAKGLLHRVGSSQSELRTQVSAAVVGNSYFLPVRQAMVTVVLSSWGLERRQVDVEVLLR